MKKRLLMILLATSVGCMLFSGCGASKTPDPEETVAETTDDSKEDADAPEGDELFEADPISDEELTEMEGEDKAEEENPEDIVLVEVENDDEVDTASLEDCKVKISIKDYGDIELELDAESAPITVDNFVSLVKSGFYDGLTFHRIIDGFMIQGGDPLGNGMGGSENKIKGEFSANGVENNISHERGVISMARSQDMNSASSQFFIVHEDAAYLDSQYAAFGHVTKGMDVVDQICKDAKPTDNNGTIPADAQPVIESIVIVE